MFGRKMVLESSGVPVLRVGYVLKNYPLLFCHTIDARASYVARRFYGSDTSLSGEEHKIEDEATRERYLQ